MDSAKSFNVFTLLISVIIIIVQNSNANGKYYLNILGYQENINFYKFSNI